MVKINTNECFNLSSSWRNRISSILSNKCINLYTEDDCQPDKFRVTIIRDKVYLNSFFQSLVIPSYNFRGSQ